jgi:hypothetical protein
MALWGAARARIGRRLGSFGAVLLVLLVVAGSSAFALASVGSLSARSNASLPSAMHPTVASSPVATRAASPRVAAPFASPPLERADTSSPRPITAHVAPSSAFPGRHPSAWGAAGVPPGAPLPNGAALSSPGSTAASGAGANLSQGNLGCWSLGPAPNTGSSYLPECYGHDEPNINFYSDLPGSGGNVTWNVTLPTDRNATANQSSLYVAIWFGMTLNDPFAWMDQCFLELQFYPDQTWTNGPGLTNPALTVNGAWIGQAVAWQIEAYTGFEDPCYLQPLYLHNAGYGAGNGTYLNMTQGDRITVTMTGWTGSPYGENISVFDQTQHAWSNLTMFNSAQNYPIDPSYSTSTTENALQWTPGGEAPVSFAFETGHASTTYPGNNSFGGCSAGAPPPTPWNGAVPCPSYDPGSWINDTGSPWHIDAPTFFNATARQGPAQVGFGQDLGGISYTDGSSVFGSSYTGCVGHEGSAWCSYPWYSYSCAQKTFHFGATDYPGGLLDFGKYDQYATSVTANAAGFSYYPLTNFSIPTCGGTSEAATIQTQGTGSVNFLSTAVIGTQTFDGLAPGEYGVHAMGAAGESFEGWSVSGGVTVTPATSAYATLHLSGTGTAIAIFGASSPLTQVIFNSSTPGAMLGIAPSSQCTTPVACTQANLATLPVGGSYWLASGLYAVQAYPPVGYNFSSWDPSNAGAVVASPGFPVSDLIVTGAASSTTLDAAFTASASSANVAILVIGNGTVAFNGTPISEQNPLVGSFSTTVPVGTYSLDVTPGPSWSLGAIYYGSNAVMTNFSADTWVNLENGTVYGSTYIEVFLVETPGPLVNVTFDDGPAAGGAIGLYGTLPLANNTTAPVNAGAVSVMAAPSSNYTFVGWAVSNSSALWEISGNTPSATVIVNASGVLTAIYAPASPINLTFAIAPAAGGAVEFNLGPIYTNGQENTTLTVGVYAFTVLPAPGYEVVSVYGTGAAGTFGNLVFVTGSGGVLHVLLAALPAPPYPVTFYAEPLGALQGAINGTGVASSSTVWLAPGTYSLSAVPALPNASFGEWMTAGGVSVGNAVDAATTITVATGGAVYAEGTAFSVERPTATPSVVDVGSPSSIALAVLGATNYTVVWSGLPPGCPAGNTTAFVCAPTQAGSYRLSATVSAPDGATAASPSAALVAVVLPTVAAFTVSPATITLGSSTTLNATVVGGTLPYTFAYTGLPSGCASTNLPQLTCAPTAAGAYSVTVHVADAFGHVANASVDLTVHLVPSVAGFTVSPSPVTVGIASNFAIIVSGGTLPYAYRFGGLPAGCTASSATFTCTPTAPGAYSVGATVTDASGIVATGSVVLTVNPAPSITAFGANPTSVTLGGSVTFTVTATGGTGPLTYSYQGLPAGCTGANASTVQCTPSAANRYSITASVHDAFGVVANRSLIFAVTTTSPTGPAPSAGLTGAQQTGIGLAIALVAVGLIAALLVRQRRRRAAAPEDRGAPGGTSNPASRTLTDGDEPADAPD